MSAPREEIEAFLAAHQLSYQRIELPYGLATAGEDRSATAALVFPPSLDGESVLDIGSFLGYFCHEAKRRGAGRVVGLEVDETRLAQARDLARFAGHDIEFRRHDIERAGLEERFDHVLLLNVVHHMHDPLAVLRRATQLTKHWLVLEVPSILDTAMRAYFKKEFGLRRRHLRWLNELPVIGVGRCPARRGREQRFFFAPKALENLLLRQGNHFARVEIRPSPIRGRYVAVAERRRIGTLALVAGAPGAGKSVLGERWGAGQDVAVARELGLPDVGRWPLVHATGLSGFSEATVAGMLLHYDLMRPRRGGNRVFDRDQALDALACAERTVVVVVYAPGPILVERLRVRAAETKDEEWQHDYKLSLRRFSRAGESDRLYAEWVRFCARRNLTPRFVDASTPTYRVLPEGDVPAGVREALARLGDDAAP